jgi:hypothetical protein
VRPAAGGPGDADAARLLAHRLASLEEGKIRSRAAARALGALEPERGLALVAAVAREEGIEARLALAAVAQALADPEPELPYAWRAELYSLAVREGASEVAAFLLAPPPLRTFEEPLDKPDPRLAHLTLGHKKAFARSHRDPDLLARLAAEGEPAVVRELLRNPQLTEAFVVRIAARRPCRPGTLRCLFESRRWRIRPAVALAIARNPYAEPAVAVKLVPLLGRSDLGELARDATVHPLVRGIAEQLAARGRDAAARRRGATGDDRGGAAGDSAARAGGRALPASLDEPAERVAQGGDPRRDEDEQRHEEDDETDLEHGGRA